MDLAQLQQLVAGGESETLEFKKTTGQRSEAMHDLCAMLNHRGGRVLFGVDSEGKIVGQQVSERTIEEVSQEIQQIEPPIFPRIDQLNVADDRQVVSVTVPVGTNRPYSYKGQAYRRVGNTSLKMSRDEYNQMLIERVHGERRWETEPAKDWTVQDLDRTEITRTVEEAIRRGRLEDPGTRDVVELLRGLGLMRQEILLRAAIVLFGKSERLEAEFPQCLLRVAKFKGTDKAEFLDNRQFNGHAFELLVKAERFLRENLPVAGRIVPTLFERKDDPLYPPVALREALANAFCHRDYSIGGGSVAVAIYQDRLEITSSGTFHFGLTAEKLFAPHESLPWNPLIARVFYRRGIIEQWGRGTLKMAELTRRAGLPRPEIEEQAGSVVVRFRPSRYIPPRQVRQELTEQQRLILQLLSERPGIGRKEILTTLNLELRPLKKDLENLKRLGLIVQRGKGRGSVWYLAESASDRQ